MGWREQKDIARQRVHEAMSYPANYYAPGSATPEPCTVRLHIESPKQAGDVNGMGFATRIEYPMEAVFLLSEVSPARRGRIDILADDGTVTESYVIETEGRPYGLTINCEIKPA